MRWEGRGVRGARGGGGSGRVRVACSSDARGAWARARSPFTFYKRRGKEPTRSELDEARFYLFIYGVFTARSVSVFKIVFILVPVTDPHSRDSISK